MPLEGETTAILGLPVQIGALVQLRQDLEAKEVYKVQRFTESRERAVVATDDGLELTVGVSDVLVVKRFGEPMYATLKPLDSIQHGGDERPYHAVVKGENYHALQLFSYLYEEF